MIATEIFHNLNSIPILGALIVNIVLLIALWQARLTCV